MTDQDPAEPAGCPHIRWDGPYQFRCRMGAATGICATHGRFRPAPPTGADEPCPHEDFAASVDVHRLTASDDDATVIGFSVNVEMHCANPVCQERFRFTGAPAGLLPDRPTVSVDEFTLHAPIRPATADPDFGLGIPGYAIAYRTGEQP